MGDLSHLLESYCPDLGTLPATRIAVARDNILTDTVAFFKSKKFDIRSTFRVRFENEPAVDGGGPRREFFTLLLRSLIFPDTPFRLFEGKAGHILPIHNIDALMRGMFKFAGNMIAASIVQGEPGFPMFSSAFYTYLQTQDLDDVYALATPDDIPDPAVAHSAKQVIIISKFNNCLFYLLIVYCITS